MRRIYLGIKISEKLQEEILAWERSWSDSLSGGPVRWLSGRNLHLTLIPPFEADDRLIAAIIEKLKTAGNISGSFALSLDRVTFGPEPRAPRLIWAEGNVPEEMLKLKSELERLLNIKAPSRSFKAHLTLARFRPESFSSLNLKSLDVEVGWKEVVTGVDLIESHLGSQGAEYETLYHLPFER